MRFEFGHLILLAMLLLPGIVSGSIVSWRIRSPLALFFTIGSSLASSFLVCLLGTVICTIVAPFFPFLSKTYGWFPLGILVYIFLLPTGLISGATLSGMLLLVKDRLKRANKTLDLASIVISGIGNTLVSTGLSLLLMYGSAAICQALITLIAGKQDHLGVASIYLIIYYGLGGILALFGTLACGLSSAVFGIKLANILR